MTFLSGLLAFDDHARPLDAELARVNTRQIAIGGLNRIVRADGALFCASAGPANDLSPACVLQTSRYCLVVQARSHDMACWRLDDFVGRWSADKGAALGALAHDFALALWDGEERALYLARAPLSAFGLAYRHSAGGAAFATLASALWDCGDVDVGRLVLPLLREPVFGAPTTAFRDVALVACGTLVRIDRRGAIKKQFWDPASIDSVDRSDADAAANLRRMTQSAVADALDGTGGDVASYLSAGRDSGIVTALAARQLADRRQDVAAYTAVPIDGYDRVAGRYLYDERAGAGEVASLHPNIVHHVYRPGPFHLCAALDRANRHLPAPYGTPVNLAWYYGIQAEAARRGARLLLSGGTGNLTLSNGGPWALSDLLDDSLLAWGKAVRAAVRAPGASLLNLLATSVGGRVPAAVYRAAEFATRRRPSDAPPLFLKSALRHAFMTSGRTDDRRPPRSYRASLTAALAATDLHDPNEEALHGLAVRDPTADLRVVRAALELTPRQIASPYDRRPMFERAFADVLPASTLRSPLRGAQSADWNQVICPDELRRGLRRYGESPLVRELIDTEALVATLDHWPRGVLVDDPRGALFTSQVLPLTSMASFLFIHTAP